MPSKSWRFLTPVLLFIPGFAFGGSIDINNNCVVGSCPPSGMSSAILTNQSIGPTPGSYLLMFGDGDSYQINWAYSGSYNGTTTQFSIDPMATYVGTSPSVGNDVIDFQFFQNFYDDSRANWDGDYTENVPLTLSANAGPGSTVSGESFYDGQGLGLVGPFGPGNHIGQNTVDLTGLDDPTLAAEFQFNVDFQSGTAPGANATAFADVPEPAGTLPLAILFIGLGFRLLSVVAALALSKVIARNKLMEQNNNDSPAEPTSDRREMLEKLGRFAVYAAPFTLLITSKKAAAATSIGPDS